MGPDLWEMFEDGKADDEVAAIIRLGRSGVLPKGVRVVTQFGEIITVRMTRADLPAVSSAPEVANMVAGDSYLGPDVEIESAESTQDLSFLPTDERRPKEEKATGAGVVIGVVDWGFDFAHPDFRKSDGTSRILALWDQRGSRRPGSPQPFGYGIVHDREAINRALRSPDPYAALGYHPADADTGFGSHGTHVASIAAGMGAEDRPSGMAPDADLVLVHNAPWDEAEPSRLGDSVTLLEGIDFIARTAGDRAWVINLSMGRHSGFHNGQELVEQGFDAAVRTSPGRAICLSAGNYFSKHIHASGQLRPSQSRTLAWQVKENDPTNNQLEFWYSWQDKMELAVRSPDGSLQATVKIGERAKLISGGKEIGNVYHRGPDPISLNNHISVFLYPEASAGDWELTLIGSDVIDGRYHAWIERDVSCPRCQSRFRPEDADRRSTTGTICNGRRTFAVGAHNSHAVEPRLAPFSSCGPTLDGRLKPDLCAPGVGVLAARSAIRDKTNPAPLLTRMSGTSMASPHVAGTIALMFQVAPRRLRIEETHNLLLESAEKVSIPDELPDRIGIGFLNVTAAVLASRNVGRPSSTLKETTIQVTSTKEKVSAAAQSEGREVAGVGEKEATMETNGTTPAGCGCEHTDAGETYRQSQVAYNDFVEDFYVAEDDPKRFASDDPPKDVADALAAKNWSLALSLAIGSGARDENVLTDLVFFARHPELPRGKLDANGARFKALSREWGQILNDQVWKAIQAASANTSLVVSGPEVADHDRFFWGATGKKLKRLVEQTAKEVDLNPGLLGAIMMAETRDPLTYLSSEKVSSYYIGTDDFYEARAQIAARVPAFAKIKWDKNQTPVTHPNDAKKPREVKSILFDSGPDAILATAVYVKFREVRLREISAQLNDNFDKLPVETRLALTRIAMAAGTEGARPFLKDALAGKDIFIRKDIPAAIYQTQRNATIRTAQAIHLSEWIFGISLAVTTEADALEAGDQEETEEGLRKKLAFLSLLPHFSQAKGSDVQLTPAGMDPGIYDGSEKFKIAAKLQECLTAAVNKHNFGHIRVALVDLTKDVLKPEFAGFNHKDQVFAASLPKIAAMLAAFQLRHDLEAALKNKSSKDQDELFASVRDDWAATQNDPKGAATPFADGITVRGKLVLWKDKKVELSADIPKSPKLESIFPQKDFPAVKFSSTGETKDDLTNLINEFDSASGEVGGLKHKASSTDEKVKADALKRMGKAQNRLNKATHKLESLGFQERLRVAMGGLVPASNFIISTIVRDVGYPYIASTLLQSGLYDPNREGGLWLGASYWHSTWRGALAGGSRQSTTAGSAAAFMTLLVQDRLVDPTSSAEMRALIHKEPNPTHPGIVSWFKEGLKQLPDEGNIEVVLSKLGAFDGIDDCAFIERKVDQGNKLIRYVAIGLRARKTEELKTLILELDKCILANNGLTAAQGGHSAEYDTEQSWPVEAEVIEALENRHANRKSATNARVAVDLIELADDIAACCRNSRVTTPILHEMVSKLGLSESLAIAGEKRAVSAAELFDALSSARATQLRQKASQLFEIVALPSTPLQQELRKGDLIVRRGDNDRGHIAVVSRPALLSLKTLLSEGIVPESLRDGNYTEVVETGVRPHTSSDHFARQLTDSAGRLLNDILLLRLATPPTVVQVQQQPAKTGDEPDVASEDVELCASDISEFGRSWRASHDMRRNPRPQTQGGKPLCRGQNDLKSHGPNSSTVDLLLFNFDIDGSYPKIQHEKALANLISAIHDNIMSNPRADQNATAYEVFLQGYADRTGSARYNELLANDREAAVESYLRANIDRFTKIPELPIGPLIRYNRMTGGFAPDALPGRNTAHARAVLVWAVPTGGVKPPPRPVPKPSTAFDELTDLVRPVSMGLTADKAKVLAPLATPGAVFTKTMSFPGGWNAILVVNAGGTAASMVEFPVSMVHGGTTHVMPAVVFQSLSWKKLAVSDKSFTGGAEIALPLTNRFILAVADASGTLKTISGGASDIFPIETDIQTYATVVFGYLVDGQTGNVEALDISQAPSGQLRGFLNNHGQSAEASSSKAAVLITCELSLTGPKDDFQPKGPSPIGPANVVRTYPLLSVWSSRPLSSVNGSLDMLRPSRSPMDDMAAGGLISNGFYTDVNGTVLSLWDCLSPVWKRVLTLTPVLPGVPASAGPAVVAAMRSVPCTRWDSIFAHYKLDANVSNATVVAPGLARRTNTSARQVWDLSTGAYRTSAAPVVKVERQGMFDNIHVAPAMNYQRVAAFMAPLCHHDCLHIHWRWGEQYTDQPLRGWSGGKPYRKSGAPMIPENQTLRISAHGPSVTYMPMAQYVPAQSWQIFMHHGTGYVSALTFLGATAPLLELAQLSPNLPDFAPFYYHNRMHEIGGASRAADRSRLNESSFGPLESM